MIAIVLWFVVLAGVALVLGMHELALWMEERRERRLRALVDAEILENGRPLGSVVVLDDYRQAQ